MVYLDYSATTFPNKEVIDSFNKTLLKYPGNANSMHELGRNAYHLIEASTKQVAELLNVLPSEVIFTSGASEANNLAIMGTILKFKNRGKHIITTKLEHSSVLETMEFLKKNGYKIDYLKLDSHGHVVLNKLSSETILVSIAHVNSELGVVQDINKLGEILKEYPKVIFHVDGTQAIGKIPVDLSLVDLYSMSSHKIYGLKGVGALIKKKNIELEPIIHGGKSQTIYRSGTPTQALYASFAKALKLSLLNSQEKYNQVVKLNAKLRRELKSIEGLHINSDEFCIPHILNISLEGIKPEVMLNALSLEEIYISTKTACSNSEVLSLSVLEVKEEEYARTSLRISLSYLTTESEIDYFIKVFKEKTNELRFRKGE